MLKRGQGLPQVLGISYSSNSKYNARSFYKLTQPTFILLVANTLYLIYNYKVSRSLRIGPKKKKLESKKFSKTTKKLVLKYKAPTIKDTSNYKVYYYSVSRTQLIYNKTKLTLKRRRTASLNIPNSKGLIDLGLVFNINRNILISLTYKLLYKRNATSYSLYILHVSLLLNLYL